METNENDGCGVQDLVKAGALDETHRMDSLVDLHVVAHRLGVCTRTVHRLIAAGELPPPVRVGRASRWFTSDVAGFLDKLRQGRTKHLLPASERGVA